MNFSDASDIRLGSSTITALYYGSTLIWPSGTNWANEYLQVEALEPLTLTTNMPATKTANDILDIQYSTDTTTWNNWNENVSLSMQTGNIVYFKGSYILNDPNVNELQQFITTTDKMFNVQGNIMSLIYGDNFVGQTSLSGYDNCFSHLFTNTASIGAPNVLKLKIINANNLILPATTLADDCYKFMFLDCSSLTSTPSLPATTLTTRCYCGMFYGCTSLTSAPSLPATTLAYQCYVDMFHNCTSLTSAPSLPATTLPDDCYERMFAGCTSLTSAPSLPATTLADYCYLSMFNGCTSLINAPYLPATTLTTSCYELMFAACTSLSYVQCMATDISASRCTTNWFYEASASGTFVKDANMNNWTTGDDGIPSGWTVQNAS